MQEIAEAVARIRQEWAGVMGAIVAACNGNPDASAQLAPFLDDLGSRDDWKPLVAAIRQILAGERDPEKLLANLDDMETLIVSDTLRVLGVDPRTLPALPGEEPGDDDGEMISLEDFIKMATEASRADAPAEMRTQMLNATRGMSMQADAQPEIRELGRVLNQIIAGNHNPDLLTLHPQLIGRVRQMLDELKT
jgi:hypothetical protein